MIYLFALIKLAVQTVSTMIPFGGLTWKVFGFTLVQIGLPVLAVASTEEDGFWHAAGLFMIAMSAALPPLLLAIKNWLDLKIAAVKVSDLKELFRSMERRQMQLDCERDELKAIMSTLEKRQDNHGKKGSDQ